MVAEIDDVGRLAGLTRVEGAVGADAAAKVTWSPAEDAAAVAGICQAAQETQGDPETGLGYELDAIAGGERETGILGSALRMALATSVTLMYISCFLYLWV